MKMRQILILTLAVGLAPLVGWSAVAAATNAPAQPQTPATDSGTHLSPPARDVLKMASKGVPDDVLKAYIDNSGSTFNLTPDAIVYLQSQGVSGPVTTEMLSHDKALIDRASAFPPIAQPAPLTPPATVPYPAVDTTQPDYSYAAPPVVNYVYNEPYQGGYWPGGYWYYAPAYGGWCWYPFVGFGLGWGFGFHHRFHDFDRFHHFDHDHDFDRFHRFDRFNHFNGGAPFHHQFTANRGFTPSTRGFAPAARGFNGFGAGGGFRGSGVHFASGGFHGGGVHLGGSGFHGGGEMHFGGGGFHGGGGSHR
jgi:hypothetical protein